MPKREKLSPSSEDYLETVLDLSVQSEAVRSVDIAKHLSVSKASVTKAMGILREAGLIEQAHYGAIHLTEAGQKRGQDVRSRHTMIKRFLMEILEIDEETAEQDACRMEHAICPTTRQKWFAWLDQVLDS